MPVYLNPGPLEERVAAAGLTMGEFARYCGVSSVTISQARHGRAIRASTLRALALGLVRLKDLPGTAELVTATPPNGHKKKVAEALPPARATKQEDQTSGRPAA
jgi:transcriptional regulator with XRE-family HTH domain